MARLHSALDQVKQLTLQLRLLQDVRATVSMSLIASVFKQGENVVSEKAGKPWIPIKNQAWWPLTDRIIAPRLRLPHFNRPVPCNTL